MAVWITDMYWYVLSWTRLAHMMEGLIELDQQLFHLIVRVLNWGWIYTSNVRLSGAAQVLYMLFKDIILHAWWCICADQLVVIGGLVFRVACTNYLRCCGGPHLYTPKNWSANFLYWWGEFSTPGSTTCQHPQEVTANHNNKLATN